MTDGVTGPIPTHAGEPQALVRLSLHLWAYPHSRGGTLEGTRYPENQEGLSPLTRGNPLAPAANRSESGPIPTHAGEPLTPNSLMCMRKQ